MEQGDAGIIMKAGTEAIGIASYRTYVFPTESTIELEFLATKYHDVGESMMTLVCQKAVLRNAGIHLKSLPDAEHFYKKCGMKFVRARSSLDLNEFEFTAEQARAFWETRKDKVKQTEETLADYEPEDGAFCASAAWWQEHRKDIDDLGQKFNPYHDSSGRFSTGGSGPHLAPDTGGSFGGGATDAHIPTAKEISACKTVKQLEKVASSLGIDLGFEGFVVNGKEIPAQKVKYGQQVLTSICSSIDQCPIYQRALGRRGGMFDETPLRLTIHDRPKIEDRSSGEFVCGYYDPSTRSMHVGIGERGQMTKPKPSLGSFYVDSSCDGIARHEFGHHVSEVVKRSNKSWVLKGAEDFLGAGNDRAVVKMVSHYGRTNGDELFAEVFCAATHPNFRAAGKTKGTPIGDLYEAIVPGCLDRK
jgi:hypothetical protein